MALMTGDEKHGPVATSGLDALRVLYDRVPRRAAVGESEGPGGLPRTAQGNLLGRYVVRPT